jgi:hypothetical protein
LPGKQLKQAVSGSFFSEPLTVTTLTEEYTDRCIIGGWRLHNDAKAGTESKADPPSGYILTY